MNPYTRIDDFGPRIDNVVSVGSHHRTDRASDLDMAPDPIGLEKVFAPLVRRVYPNLIAQDLVGVQPLSSPGGAVFYLKHVQQIGEHVEMKMSDFEHCVAKESEMKSAEFAKTVTEMANKVYQQTLLENKKPADWAIVHPSAWDGQLA